MEKIGVRGHFTMFEKFSRKLPNFRNFLKKMGFQKKIFWSFSKKFLNKNAIKSKNQGI